jgi:hypothetical protein
MRELAASALTTLRPGDAVTYNGKPFAVVAVSNNSPHVTIRDDDRELVVPVDALEQS